MKVIYGLGDFILDDNTPKLIYRLNVIFIKIPSWHFWDQQADHKIHMEIQGRRIDKTTLKGKISWVLILLGFRSYHRGTLIKTLWYWHKNRFIERWNRIESSEINPHIYGQFIFDKGTKNIQWEIWVSFMWASTCKGKKLYPYLT